jgi:predicted PurR-regulated permease PerM
MRGEAFRWFVRGTGFAFGVAVAVAFLGGAVLAAKVLVLVFIALLLASALEPFVGYIRGHVNLGRGATILIVYAGFFAAVVVLLLLVVPGAINQFNDIGVRLTPLLDNARAWAATIEPRALSASLGELIDALQEAIRPRGGGEAPDASEVLEVGVTVADLVISVVSMLALVFFWLTEHARLQRWTLAFVPADRRAGAREAWNEIESRLGSWVRGQLILMGTMGVMATAAYLVLGLEGALFLGLIAAVAEAIPLVGPLLGAVPALLVAAMTGRVELVVAVAVVYVFIQIVEGNVLVPVVMRNTIGTPPFVVLASILGGAAIGGILGALLAVPVVAALTVILERLQARESPIPLDPGGSTAPPDEETRTAARATLPDARGSAAGR